MANQQSDNRTMFGICTKLIIKTSNLCQQILQDSQQTHLKKSHNDLLLFIGKYNIQIVGGIARSNTDTLLPLVNNFVCGSYIVSLKKLQIHHLFMPQVFLYSTF